MSQLPHYHVLTLTDGQYLDYSDGRTEAGALAYAADLISPTSGQRDELLEGVWIARVDPRDSCPLAHGDSPRTESEAALYFLQQVMQFEPYWSIFD